MGSRSRSMLLPLALSLCLLAPASAHGYLFFGAEGQPSVGRANSDGSSVDGDWLTDLDDVPAALTAAGDTVFVANIEGLLDVTTNVSSINQDGTDYSPSLFTVPGEDPVMATGSGQVFVGTGGPVCPNDPGLNVANFDGTGQTNLPLLAPDCRVWGGIASIGSSVYYLDMGEDEYPQDATPTIKRRFPGGGEDVLLDSSQLSEPSGFTSDGTYLYWTDSGGIGRAALEPDGSVDPDSIDVDWIESTLTAGAELPATDDTYIYWVGPDQGGLSDFSVYRAQKSNGFGATMLFEIPNTFNPDENGDFPTALTATVPVSAAVPSPGFLSFPAGNVGNTAIKELTIQNPGELPLTAPDITFSGPAAGDYSVETNLCTQPVQPGGMCVLVISFTPGAPGTRNAAMELSDDAPNSPQQVPLAGIGMGASPGISPQDHDFGEQEVRAGPTAPTTLTISNTGNEPTGVTNIAPDPTGDTQDFDLDAQDVADCKASPIPVGEECELRITFDPATSGDKELQVDVTAAQPAAPATVSATLTGTGIEPQLTITPGTVEFPDTQEDSTSPPETVTLANPGTAPLQVEQIHATGDYASQFAAGSGCIGTLGPGSQCQFDVTFSPGSVGTRSAQLEVQTDYYGDDTSTTLTGTGVSPRASLTPPSADFGDLNVGAGPGPSTTFTYTNTGVGDITVEPASLTGHDPEQFTIPDGGDGCNAATLDPAESCTVAVAFQPTQGGQVTAYLEIDDDVFTNAHTVPLNGTGTKPQISVSPDGLVFGELLLGSGSESSEFSIGNPGTGPLTVSGASPQGPDATAFSVDAGDCTDAPIPASTADGCTVEVGFAPGSTGMMDASVRVNSDATAGPSTVSLEGLACPPLALSARALRAPRPHLVAAAIDGSPAALLSVNGTLRFRLKGKKFHSASLGTVTVASGAELLMRVPKKLGKRMRPGAKAQLELAGTGTATSPQGCSAQQFSEPPLPVRVGR